MPAIHFFRVTVRLTFVFNPLQRISDALELTFGHLCFLIKGVPPQSNHPAAAVPFRVKTRRQRIAVSHFCLLTRRNALHNGSCLLFDSTTTNQQQPVVKLHGVFVSHSESSACSPRSKFARSKTGTVGQSLRHSCKPPIKRRGITLP